MDNAKLLIDQIGKIMESIIILENGSEFQVGCVTPEDVPYGPSFVFKKNSTMYNNMLQYLQEKAVELTKELEEELCEKRTKIY